MKQFFSFCAIIFTSAFLLASCQSMLPKGAAPAKTFTLNAPNDFGTTSQLAPRSLPSIKIMMPQAAPGLDTARVALRNGDNQIEYYRDIRWADSIPALMQSLLVESFDNSFAFNAVSNDLVDISSDYHLLVDIRDFQIEYRNQKPYANIRLVTKLVQNASQSIVSTRNYHVKTDARATKLQDIMTAFDTAYQQVARHIVSDTMTQLRGKRK